MPCVSGLGSPPRESIKPQRVSVPLLNIPKPPPKSASSKIPTIRSAVSSLLSCPKPPAEKVPQLPVPVMPKVLMPRTPLITPPPSPAVPPPPEMNTTGHRALKSGASKMTSVSALTPRIPIPLVSAARLPSAVSGRGQELGSIPGPVSSAPPSPVVPVSAAGQLVGREKMQMRCSSFQMMRWWPVGWRTLECKPVAGVWLLDETGWRMVFQFFRVKYLCWLVSTCFLCVHSMHWECCQWEVASGTHVDIQRNSCTHKISPESTHLVRGITTPTTMTHRLMSNWLVCSVISCTSNVLGRIFLCCVSGSCHLVQYFREFSSSAMFQGVIFLCTVLRSHLPLVIFLCSVSGSHLPLQCFRESSSFAMFQGLLFLCNVSGSPHPLQCFKDSFLCNVSGSPHPLQCFKDSSSFAMFQGLLFLCNVLGILLYCNVSGSHLPRLVRPAGRQLSSSYSRLSTAPIPPPLSPVLTPSGDGDAAPVHNAGNKCKQRVVCIFLGRSHQYCIFTNSWVGS